MNQTMNSSTFNKKYSLFNKRDFHFVNVQIEDEAMSKTTSGNFQFAQASQYPTHYQVPSDMFNSKDDRSLFDLEQFKQRLQKNIRTPFNIQENRPLNISPESRHKLMKQMHNIKASVELSQRANAEDTRSLMGKTVMNSEHLENEMKKTDHSSLKNQKAIEITIDAS